MTPPPPFTLSDGERVHPLWNKIRGHLEARLAQARTMNDQMMTEADTAAMRGRIACLKELIKLDEDQIIIG